jgi:hypothetical protein
MIVRLEPPWILNAMDASYLRGERGGRSIFVGYDKNKE